MDDALAAQVGSLYALPLLTRAGRPIGSVTLLLPDEQPLDRTDEALVAAQADHAGRALTRARRYEQEHDVAVALQRSLLPETLPAIEGVDLAGRYSAGGVGLEVGGDWYDALRRPGRDRPPHRRRRRRARHRRRRADGPAPQRLPGARLRAHLAGRDRAADAAPRARRGHGDGRLPHLRPVHRRARLQLGRPSADAAPRRATTGTVDVPRRGVPRRRSAGPRARRSARSGCSSSRGRRCSPTRTASSSAAARASTTASSCCAACWSRTRSARPATACDAMLNSVISHVAGRRRHGAAARPRHRGAGDDGDRGAVGSGGDANRAPARRHVAGAARRGRRPAGRHGARDHRGVQQRDRARLPRPGRDDPADARAPRAAGSTSRSRTTACGASRGPIRRAAAAS